MAHFLCAFGLLCTTTAKPQFANNNFYQSQSIQQHVNEYNYVQDFPITYENSYNNYPATSCPYFHYTSYNGQTEGSLSLESLDSTSLVRMEFSVLAQISAS